ncbi:MAG: ferrous iron transport protein A [Deltaproteobacteria bacterium]|nr:ferrous iron transport protein A [Deltaproteobacteria bacterium]
MTLLNSAVGALVEIRAILGGAAITNRMHALGFYKGSMIRVVKAAPFRGPLLIEDAKTGARVMIGRGMADKIEVISAEKT